MKKIIISTIALSLTAPFAFAQTAGQGGVGASQNTQPGHHAEARPDQSQDRFGQQSEDRLGQGATSQQSSQTQPGTFGSDDQLEGMRDSASQWGDDLRQSGSANLSEMKSISRQDLQRHETVDQLRDAEIVDSENNSLGSITDIALENGEVSDVYLRVGGILGFGGDLVRIPFEALQKEERSEGERSYRLDVQEEDFTSALDDVGQSFELRDGKRAEVVERNDTESRETAERALGARVTDMQGEELGTISDLLMEDRRITAAVIELDSSIRDSAGDRDTQSTMGGMGQTGETGLSGTTGRAGAAGGTGTAGVTGTAGTAGATASGGAVGTTDTAATGAGTTGADATTDSYGAPMGETTTTGATGMGTGAQQDRDMAGTTTGAAAETEGRATGLTQDRSSERDSGLFGRDSDDQDSNLVQIPFESLQSVDEDGEKSYRLNVSREEFQENFRRVTQRMGNAVEDAFDSAARSLD